MKFRNVLVTLALTALACCPAIAGPYATEVISYIPGTNPSYGYDDPNSALGMPSLETPGWPTGYQDVTVFVSPWATDQIVSIGAGGELVLAFDHRVDDDPFNPFGIDLIVFGSALFADADWPNGLADGIMAEPARIAVSQDGIEWYDIEGVFADDLYPTQAYVNTSTSQGADGNDLSDFTKPVDPNTDCFGKTYSEIVALYDGSGGGTGVDFSATGLAWIKYVKIYQPQDDYWSAEIDAVSDVTAVYPEPAELAKLRINNAIVRKMQAIEAVELALAEEKAAMDAINELLDRGDTGEYTQEELLEAAQNIHSAIQHETMQTQKSLAKSIDKLGATLDILGREPADNDTLKSEFKLIRSDLDGDGVVNAKDFAIMTGNWLRKHPDKN